MYADNPILIEARNTLINRMGVDEYLKAFKEYLDSIDLSPKEKFEEYYKVRQQLTPAA